MPKHRGLTFRKFVSAVPPEFLDEYFGRLRTETVPGAWERLNGDALAHFLTQPENTEAAGVIREDFQRINDICESGMGILVRACQKYGIDFDADRPREALAMHLFLHHPKAFNFAWSRYLLFATSSRLSVHPLPVDGLPIEAPHIDSFQEGVKRWFAGQAKGEQCVVSCFEDRGETVILVRHGSYIRTVPIWKGDDVSMNSFRPALEDVLVYEPDTSLLRIKATLAKDRQEYLRLFAACIAGDEKLAEAAAQGEVFTLAPLQEGTFAFGGDGSITRIELVKVRMKLYGVTNPELELRAPDVRDAFEYDLGGLTLNSGVMTLARFRFHLHPDGEKPAKVTFEIEPPSRTDLAQKRYADIIERYLMEQGVKLL